MPAIQEVQTEKTAQLTCRFRFLTNFAVIEFLRKSIEINIMNTGGFSYIIFLIIALPPPPSHPTSTWQRWSALPPPNYPQNTSMWGGGGERGGGGAIMGKTQNIFLALLPYQY